ncbi:unnamed protein product [Citrullus colocynthis]|uniref:Uncharacterized protein n=1 Tax=Citrullus colocynthis TaxID=252529 RepID=A0ABP0YRX1_9ROSI
MIDDLILMYRPVISNLYNYFNRSLGCHSPPTHQLHAYERDATHANANLVAHAHQLLPMPPVPSHVRPMPPAAHPLAAYANAMTNVKIWLGQMSGYGAQNEYATRSISIFRRLQNPNSFTCYSLSSYQISRRLHSLLSEERSPSHRSDF